MKEEWKVDGSSFVGWERDGKWKLSLMMAHYLRHNHQATANRALSTSSSFPFLSLSFPSLPLLVPVVPFLYLLHPDFSRVVRIVETNAIFPVCRNLLHRQD